MDTTAVAAHPAPAGFPLSLFQWLGLQARGPAAHAADDELLQAILPAVVDSIRCYA